MSHDSDETTDWPDPRPTDGPDSGTVFTTLAGFALLAFFVIQGAYLPAVAVWLGIVALLVLRPFALGNR